MGLFFNKLKTEDVYKIFKEKVPAMEIVGFPEDRTFTSEFKLSIHNMCDENRCQFGIRWKYLGKWDIEIIFYFGKKGKEITSSATFHNLTLSNNKYNEASDDLRRNLKIQMGSNYTYSGIRDITYDPHSTYVSMEERKIKNVSDVPKYLLSIETDWRSFKVLETMTQFKTNAELGIGVHEIAYEYEGVEIDGGIDNL